MTIVTFKAHEVFKAEAKDMKSKSEWTHQNVKNLLKYRSEEKGSSFCKCSILLGFIMSKKLRGLWFYLLIKVQNATSLVFLT